MSNELKPCPFCGAAATMLPVARDWWRITVYHDEGCFLADAHEPTAPQTPEGGAALAEEWDRRAPVADSAMAKDAERWRWLKMRSSVGEQQRIMSTPWGQWDAFADAAIAAKESTNV